MIRRMCLAWFILFTCATPSFAQPADFFLVGAAEVEITPEVATYEDDNRNGRFDLGDPKNDFGFGDRVTAFVDGPIYVGNGAGQALYVYDRLFAHAMVLEDPKTHQRIALVNADVYMITGPDIEKIRSMVDPAYGIDYIAIAATHNHMGPDTLGLTSLGGVPIPRIINTVLVPDNTLPGVNRKWFEKFRRAVVESIHRAAASVQPATIRLASTSFFAGVNDMREPHIIDPKLNIMAVDGVDGKPIATLIQWSNHPEAVLLYGKPGYEDDLLSQHELTARQKEAWGRVFTAGFPGYARQYLRQVRGGVPMYFNGAIGGMMTPIGARLWDPEAHPSYPITTPPKNIPKEILIPPTFRFAPVLGRELAKAALHALDNSSEIASPTTIRVAKQELLVPMENNTFRAGASLGVMGYERGHLYDDQGRVDDRFGSWIGGLFTPGLKAYTGKNVKTEVSVVNIGQAQIINIPAEALPESIVGFPEDFTTRPEKYFPQNKRHHQQGTGYRLSAPPLESAVTGDYRFVLGLSGGELGYVIPQSDFDPPKDLKVPPFCWTWWICFDAETDPHYEESMSVGSDLEPILMKALHRLLKENPVAPPASR